MTTSRFARASRTEAPTHDDEARLYCTHPGCGRRWSVQIDKPKCSQHQWNSPIQNYNAVPFDAHDRSIPLDGKQWARRIVKAHEQGFEVRPLNLRFAREALGIHA